jgi:hypothetical protein
MAEGGDEFARRQIPARAEYDHRAGLDGSAAEIEPATQDFVQLLMRFHAITMDCPVRVSRSKK